MRLVLTATLLLSCTAALASPRSDARLADLKSCLDTSLRGMLSSGDQAELMGEAAYGVCEGIVADLVGIDLTEAKAAQGAGFSDADAARSSTFLTRRYRALVYTYARDFRANGGPTALSPPEAIGRKDLD